MAKRSKIVETVFIVHDYQRTTSPALDPVIDLFRSFLQTRSTRRFITRRDIYIFSGAVTRRKRFCTLDDKSREGPPRINSLRPATLEEKREFLTA